MYGQLMYKSALSYLKETGHTWKIFKHILQVGWGLF